jgi:hypothetical protein
MTLRSQIWKENTRVRKIIKSFIGDFSAGKRKAGECDN